MRRGIGCWSVVVVTGLVVAFPTLYFRAHPALRTVAARVPRQPPACLEAWVRLRSYRGCPVLASAGGYRLGIYCSATGWSNGALVFAGPFPGRAYLSERPVPLGAWVHLAGIEASPAWRAMPQSAPVPPAPAAIAFDGVDVTAGRLFGQSAPLPLGYDPWESRSVAAPPRAAAPVSGSRRRAPRRPDRRGISGPPDPGRRGISGPPDGETGAWRLSRRGLSLSQVAAGRGTPWRLAALPPPEAAPRALPAGAFPAHLPGRGISRRGWAILAAGLLLALAMAGGGLALRRAGPDGDDGAARRSSPGGSGDPGGPGGHRGAPQRLLPSGRGDHGGAPQRLLPGGPGGPAGTARRSAPGVPGGEPQAAGRRP
jgi:hypothetical protein